MPNGARVLQSGQIVGESGRNACGSFAGIGEVDPGITQRAEPIQRRDVTAGFLEIASVGGQQDRVRSAERRGVVEGVEQVMTQPDRQVHGRPSCLAAAISDSDRIGCLGPTVQNPANGLVALPLALGAFDGLSHQLGDDGVLVLACICGVEGVFHFVGNLELHSGHVRCSFVLRITYVGLGFAARTASRRCVAPPARSGPRR
jgi:hypothetical protein